MAQIIVAGERTDFDWNSLKDLEKVRQKIEQRVRVVANSIEREGSVLAKGGKWRKQLGVEQIAIDWDSRKALQRMFYTVQRRLIELNVSPSIREAEHQSHARRIFNACLNLWSTDTSSHYTSLVLDAEKKYYVYAHLDPTTSIKGGALPKVTFGATLGMTHYPFYIGKGTGDRYLDFNRNGNHRKVRQRVGEPIAMILKDGLSEAEALAYEDKLIDIFGLQVYGGYLTNLDEGYHPVERRKLYAESYAAMLEVEKPSKVEAISAAKPPIRMSQSAREATSRGDLKLVKF